MGELADAHKTEGVLRQTHIGGQALIEGIMMRGRYNWAVAVREPDGGIYTEEHDLASGKDKNGWMYKPLIRGCRALVESLVLGYQALQIAADHAFDFDDDDAEARQAAGKEQASAAEMAQGQRVEAVADTSHAQGLSAAGSHGVQPVTALGMLNDEPATVPPQDADAGVERAAKQTTGKKEPSGLGDTAMAASMVLGVALGVVIFVVAPAAITNLIMGDYGEHTLAWNIVDGVLRVAIFIAYIWLISLMKDIRRMFSYHGAEHKAIHCYEHGLELTPENAQQFPRLHVRCGTAFLIVTMLIAIFVFTVVPTNALIVALGITSSIAKLLVVILSRIVLLPVVAGIAYEVTVKWAGSHPEKPLVKIVLWPGLQMQRLTTNQPDEGMLECAIAAMNLVLAREQREAAARS